MWESEQFSISFYRHCSRPPRCPVQMTVTTVGLHWTILFLLLWWYYCCASSPVVHAPDFRSGEFHFLNQTTNTNAASRQRVDFPEWQFWFCGAALFWRSATLRPWYSTVILAEYKLKKKKMCVHLERLRMHLEKIHSVVCISQNSKLST